MGRVKRIEQFDFPSLPIPFIDAMLYAEEEIRTAVKEARADFSFIGSRGTCSGNGSGRQSDRTAGGAIKLLEELPAVVLEDGRTVRKPETWLKVFDAVRMRAKQCARPEMIFDEWRTAYKGEMFSSITPNIARNIKSWIRCNVLFEARAAGLVSFSDDEIMEGARAAEMDPLGDDGKG